MATLAQQLLKNKLVENLHLIDAVESNAFVISGLPAECSYGRHSFLLYTNDDSVNGKIQIQLEILDSLQNRVDYSYENYKESNKILVTVIIDEPLENGNATMTLIFKNKNGDTLKQYHYFNINKSTQNTSTLRFATNPIINANVIKKYVQGYDYNRFSQSLNVTNSYTELIDNAPERRMIKYKADVYNTDYTYINLLLPDNLTSSQQTLVGAKVTIPDSAFSYLGSNYITSSFTATIQSYVSAGPSNYYKFKLNAIPKSYNNTDGLYYNVTASTHTTFIEYFNKSTDIINTINSYYNNYVRITADNLKLLSGKIDSIDVYKKSYMNDHNSFEFVYSFDTSKFNILQYTYNTLSYDAGNFSNYFSGSLFDTSKFNNIWRLGYNQVIDSTSLINTTLNNDYFSNALCINNSDNLFLSGSTFLMLNNNIELVPHSNYEIIYDFAADYSSTTSNTSFNWNVSINNQSYNRLYNDIATPIIKTMIKINESIKFNSENNTSLSLGFWGHIDNFTSSSMSLRLGNIKIRRIDAYSGFNNTNYIFDVPISNTNIDATIFKLKYKNTIGYSSFESDTLLPLVNNNLNDTYLVSNASHVANRGSIHYTSSGTTDYYININDYTLIYSGSYNMNYYLPEYAYYGKEYYIKSLGPGKITMTLGTASANFFEDESGFDTAGPDIFPGENYTFKFIKNNNNNAWVVTNKFLMTSSYANMFGIGTSNTNSTLQLSGSFGVSVLKTTNNIALGIDHYFVLCDTSANNILVNLPYAQDCFGRIYVIKKISGSYTVTISGVLGQLIDNSSSQTITSAYTSISIISDGANWWIT
jgi:hypothetical protein